MLLSHSLCYDCFSFAQEQQNDTLQLEENNGYRSKSECKTTESTHVCKS